MKITNIYKKYGCYLQQTGYSCGPCSILNILTMKKISKYSEKDLIEICKAKAKIGTSPANLTKAMRKVGLKISEQKQNASVADVERNLLAGRPVVVLYYHLYASAGHYAVIVEQDKKAFYFLDSSYGLIRISKKNFEKYWYSKHKKLHGKYWAIK